jgi:hypothetical protein
MKPMTERKGRRPVTLQLTLSIGFATSRATPRGTKADPEAMTSPTSRYPIHKFGLAPTLFS